MVSAPYTRSKVRKALPPDFAYIISELLQTPEDAQDLIAAVCAVIKRMAVDHMHIVGDIYDRGPRADIIMDSLLNFHSVDIQWGNHDILWMGAASGSRTLVATVWQTPSTTTTSRSSRPATASRCVRSRCSQTRSTGTPTRTASR